LKSKRKRITRKIVTTLVIVLLMGCSVSFGVGYSKQITAWYYNIQVKLDGGSLNFSNEPFIYDGRVYIPLRDVTENLGLEVTWDGDTKTVYLASNGTYNNPNYNNPYVLITKKSISEIEEELNNDYDEYTKGEDDLKFKYDLSEQSSYIKVKMEGQNFKRDSTDWDKRDDSDFRDFVEDIAKMIADELDQNVKVYVYDKSDKEAGKYEYDESDSKFEVDSEYGEEADTSDLEDTLEDKYGKYEDGSDDLEFKFDVSEKSSYVKVTMKGQNFEIDSSAWEERDTSDFKKFIKDIAEEVCDEIDNKDVKIYVEDEDDKDAARYEYDESKSELEVKSEYDGEGDTSSIESDLNSDYNEYTKGEEKLEFEYSVSEKSSYMKVEMEGKNFEADSSDWKKRNESKFQDFVEDVAKKVADEFDKDVKIDVKDEDNTTVGEYEYDESEKDFEVKEEYDGEQSLDDVKDKLDSDYDKYTDGDDGDLRFDYELTERSSYIKVEMEGKNFERDDSAWKNRGNTAFRRFVKDIAGEVNNAFEEMDVRIYVKDDKGEDTAQYKYDEGNDSFEIDDEYEK